MNLNTGKSTTHNSWTMLPMPTRIVNRLHTISNRKPIGLTFIDSNNQIIIHEDNARDDGDDDTYAPSDEDYEDDTLIEYNSDNEKNEPVTGVNHHQLKY